MGNKVVYKKDGEIKEIEFEDLKDLDNVEILEDDDDEDWDEKSIRGRITGIMPFICTIAFILIGHYTGYWHPGWLVFLLIPITPLVLKLFSGNKKGIVALFTLLIIAAYFVLGFWKSWWHPGWVIFLLIPVVGIIFGGHDD